MLRKKKDFAQKKEIKPSSMTARYYEMADWFEKSRKEVVMASLIVVVAVAAYFLVGYYKGLDNEKASLDLAKVMAIYDSGSYIEAIDGRPTENVKGLKSLVDTYSGTENGETARIYLANSYYALGKYTEAKEQYDAYSGSNELLQATALAGLAACYEAENNPAEAAGYYMKASNVSDDMVFKPKYLLYAGINYLEAGDTEEAKKLFKLVKKDYSKSAFVRDIDRYLAQVQ
ncbi:MAG: hypothetical protein FMNOHCHN_00771 [Ignavibacteriaceae bacterium]|nr:hypothetical protein [Ignavibacteriaceae bacterium]